MNRIFWSPILAASFLAPAPAHAGGLAVFDSATYLQTLATVRNTLALISEAKAQVTEAQRLYGSMNRLTDVNRLGSVLNQPAIRNILPRELEDLDAIARGHIGSGPLAQRRQSIIDAIGLDRTERARSAAEEAYRKAIDEAAGRTATQAAVAEQAYATSMQRTEGLEALRTALDQATDAKQVADLQARIAVEAAHLQNDQMKLQAVAMRQMSEDRLQIMADDARRAQALRQMMGAR